MGQGAKSLPPSARCDMLNSMIWPRSIMMAAGSQN